ncbi:methyltransferase domain-containing protein [Candidatus Woesearchaeota archaeon]|nr:methyltransferase domain-containing protein [Candidatus Woesearchaeota archaeon]
MPEESERTRKILIQKIRKAFVKELDKEVTTVKARQYFIEDLNKDFQTAYAIIPKAELQKEGEVINVQGKPYFIFSTKFIDDFKRIRRLPQTIPLKDIGYIISQTGINKNSRVLDAGVGSGALTCFIAHLCKEVIAYDIRDDHIGIAKENVAFLKLSNVIIKKKNIYEGIDETNLDLITLDVPEPWLVIKHVLNALKVGGFLVSYSPTIPQVQDFVNKVLEEEKFLHVKTVEVIERDWEVSERKVRPKSVQTGHSGFLTFVRKLAR